MKKDIYYTCDHDWIDFQGTIAYAGLTPFKLTGFRAVDEILLKDLTGLKKQGETIATIKYQDYAINLNMPVDGKIVSVNELVLKNNSILLDKLEGVVWMLLIVPANPHDRKNLSLSSKYQMNGKSKYAKG